MKFNQSVTEASITEAQAREAGWAAETKIFALDEPLYGRLGEVATHVLASTVDDEQGPETAIFAVDAAGMMVAPHPALAFLGKADTTNVGETLASLGFTVKEA